MKPNPKPGEPMFCLLGRDPFAARLVSEWAKLNRKAGINLHKVDEADKIADEMESYRAKLEAGTTNGGK